MGRNSAIAVKALGPNSGRTVEAKRWRVSVLLEQHEFERAHELLRELIPIARELGLANVLPSLELGVAQIHVHARRLDDARNAIARARASITVGSYMDARAWIVTGEVETTAGNVAAARRARDEALPVLIATRGDDHPETRVLRARIEATRGQ